MECENNLVREFETFTTKVVKNLNTLNRRTRLSRRVYVECALMDKCLEWVHEYQLLPEWEFVVEDIGYSWVNVKFKAFSAKFGYVDIRVRVQMSTPREIHGRMVAALGRGVVENRWKDGSGAKPVAFPENV